MSDEIKSHLKLIRGDLPARPRGICREYGCTTAPEAGGFCAEHQAQAEDRRKHFILMRSLMIADFLKEFTAENLTFEQKVRQAEQLVDQFLEKNFADSDERIPA